MADRVFLAGNPCALRSRMERLLDQSSIGWVDTHAAAGREREPARNPPLIRECLVIVAESVEEAWRQIARSLVEILAMPLILVHHGRAGTEWNDVRDACGAAIADLDTLDAPDLARLVAETLARPRNRPLAGGGPSVQTLLDVIPLPIALVDQEGTVVAGNERWRASQVAAGPRPEPTPIGSNYLEACQRAASQHLAGAAEFVQVFKQVAYGEAMSGSVCYPYQGSDQMLWFVAHVATVGQDEPRIVMVAHEEITAGRVQTETDLAHRAGGVSTWRWQPGSEQTFWTAGVGTVFSASDAHEADSGRRPQIHPDDADRVRDAAREAVRTDGQLDVDFRVVMPDGAEHWLNQRGRPVLNEEGDVVGMRGVTSDIQSRRLAEERRERGARASAVGAVAAKTAHEFGNLLFVIRNCVRSLQDAALPGAAATQVQSIADAAEIGAQLSRSLMSLSANDRSERETCDLVELVRRASRLWAPLLPASIELSLSLPDEPVWISADPAQLQQAVMNLVINARDAMPRGGSIRVSVQGRPEGAGAETTGHAEVRVADTGVGIRPEDTDRIFEPFFTTKEEGRGAGLGLPIVKGIIAAHGGRISINSRVGSGTTFVVRLPTVRSPANGGAAPARKRARPAVIAVMRDAYLAQVVQEAARRAGLDIANPGPGAGTPRALIVDSPRALEEAGPLGAKDRVVWVGHGPAPALDVEVLEPGMPLRVEDLISILGNLGE